jgi:hypothetical protein
LRSRATGVARLDGAFCCFNLRRYAAMVYFEIVPCLAQTGNMFIKEF